ncbi:MAG: hypothetical protein ACRDYF_07645 [Acidimicrobiia bacterium]
MRAMNDAPDHIELTLEEALDLLSALEDVRDLLFRLMEHVPLQVVDVLGPLFGAQYQMEFVRSKLGIGGELG